MTKKDDYSFKKLILYFLKLGTFGFGGPVVLIEHMERDLVQNKEWLTREEYLRGLSLSQLAPGPLATQLAIYIGFLKERVIGATLIGLAFILPSFFIVIAIGMIYVHYNGLPWMQAVFYGVGASIVGIIVNSAYKLTKNTVKKSILLFSIAAVMCAVTAYTKQSSILLFIAAGIISIFAFAPPKFSKPSKFLSVATILPLISTPAVFHPALLLSIFFFFLQSGAVVFGSGLSIVPFLYGGVVQQHHWLTDRQFLDAVAVAMITPGPALITVGFIGYLVAGFPGALVSSIAVFLPVYLIVIIFASVFERYSKHPQLRAFVHGVTAAAAGALAGACIILAQQSLKDVFTVILAILSLIAVRRFKIPEPLIIILGGILGLVFFRG